MSKDERKQFINIQFPESIESYEIPDPLEGVIEGDTRSERYRNFINYTLGKIWPESQDSGEYGDDFYRATRFSRGDLSGYSQFSPLALDPQTLPDEMFETVINHLDTADYPRIRSVPPQLTDPSAEIIPVGGSCVIETHGEHVMKEVLKGVEEGNYSKEHTAEIARHIIDMAPTITHISGAILGGHSQAVHYIESDMWAQRIEQDYGLAKEEAQKSVADAYQRIHEAVVRRSLLINPDSTVLQLNFDDLNLSDAIKTWFKDIGLPHNPEHRIVEVMHTYVGPTQLDLLKEALKIKIENNHLDRKEIEAATRIINESTLHVRAKQTDHLRWGSMNLPKDVITRKREPTDEERLKFSQDYPFYMGVRVMQSVFDANTENKTRCVAVGFADLPTFNNGVQHESRNVGCNFKGKPGEQDFEQSVINYLTSPARLNRNNVDEHLSYLRNFTADSRQQRQVLMTEVRNLQETLSPYQTAVKTCEKKLTNINGQLDKYTESLARQTSIIELTAYLDEKPGEDPTEKIIDAAKLVRAIKEKALIKIQAKIEMNEQLSKEDESDLQKLPVLIAALKQLEDGRKPDMSAVLSSAVNDVRVGAEGNKQDIENRINEKTKESLLVQAEYESANSQLALQKPLEDRLASAKLELQKNSLNLFPLSDNPFVHHAMQFLWDPDFVTFLRDAVAIQELRKSKGISKDDSNERMRQLMEKIYPKLEAYLNYLYGRVDYPLELRFSRVLT